MTLEVGKSREIILGLVLGCFIREGAVNPVNKHVDQRKMDAIGRLGGHGYSRIRDQFDLPTMSVAEWRKRNDKGAGRNGRGCPDLARNLNGHVRAYTPQARSRLGIGAAEGLRRRGRPDEKGRGPWTRPAEDFWAAQPPAP